MDSTPPATTVQWLPTLLMVVAIVFFGVMMTLVIRRRIARRQAERPDPRETIDRVKASHRRRADAHALEANLLETAQRLSAQLDTKAQRLEQLLAEADRAAAALREPGGSRDGETAEAVSISAASAPAPPPVAGPAPPRPLDPLTRSVYELADGGDDPVSIARRLDEQVGKVELILALRQQGVV